MTFCRQFLLSMAVLGLQLGIATAQPSSLPEATAPGQSLPFTQEAGAAANPPDRASCAADGCGPAARHGFVSGVGLYLIKPYFENNPAYIVNDGKLIPGTNPPQHRVTSSERVDIDQNLGAAPLIWLGYLGENGLGGRARYWYFREGTSQSLQSPNRLVTAHPAGLSLIEDQAQQLDVTSKLEVQALDIEGMQNLHAGNWDLLLSAGVRLARTNQNYNAFVLPSNGPVVSLLSGHNFQGAGPVLAAEARHKLGQSGLSLYGSARGSVVFGSAEQTAYIPIERNQGSDERNRGMVIGELELGLEYGRCVGSSWLFGQIALVGQDWFGAGSASRSTMLTTAGNDFIGGGYTVDSDIAFLGVCFRLGVNY